MPPSRWQFIDLSKDSADNLTQVKRHVMQEYMRQKRKETQQDGSSHGEDSDQKSLKRKSTKRSRSKTTIPAKASTIVGKKPHRRTAATRETETTETEKEEGAGPGIVLGPHGRSHRYSTSDSSSSPSPPSSSSFSSSSSSSSPVRYFDAKFNRNNHGIDSGPWAQAIPPRTTMSPPRTVLSAARTDPFDTLPWNTSEEDQRLFDFYVNEMPSISYGHHFRTKQAHNWYTEVFVPEAMKGPLTFVNTILVHASNTWAWVHNQQETDSTLRYRQLAISMLRDHMQRYPHDISDNVITACMSAAALEDFDPRPGHKEISWIHMRQARRLIRRRGGPITFQNTKLARLINWQDYILAGYVSDTDAFHFEDETPHSCAMKSSPIVASTSFFPSPPNSASPATLDRTPSPTNFHFANTVKEEIEIALQCEDFIDFLTRCEHLALSQRMTLSSKDAPVRYAAFGSGSTLHRILASPAEKRRTVTGDRKQFITRLAALMMINAALWDYRYSVTRTEAFIEYIVLQLRDSEVNVDASIEALLQILLACKDHLYDESPAFTLHSPSLPPASRPVGDFSQYSDTATSPFDRPWFVGRMLKVAKRLGLQSWLRVNNFLFECLMLQVQGYAMRSWENDLRREILQAPSTSYVMPALQEAGFLGA